MRDMGYPREDSACPHVAPFASATSARVLILDAGELTRELGSALERAGFDVVDADPAEPIAACDVAVGLASPPSVELLARLWLARPSVPVVLLDDGDRVTAGVLAEYFDGVFVVEAGAGADAIVEAVRAAAEGEQGDGR